MYSISEYEGEEIFQMFTPCEQVQLRRGMRSEAIDSKLVVMSFRQFQFERNFTYFHSFLHTVPYCLGEDCLTGSASCEFAAMKVFIWRKLKMESMRMHITPEGYVFYDDNLIAF